MTVASITPGEFAALRAKSAGLRIVDVRTPVEYREVHADAAVNVPLDSFDPAAVAKEFGGEGPVYLICRSGARGRQACEKLQASGFASVANIEGGIQAWEQAGLPVVRGAKSISLERQVRIAAGSLVFIGVALGFTAHPVFFGLSAFVGAGLVFAGVTDTCAMGMLLARMPWNRR